MSEPSVAEVANLVPDGATFVTSAGRGWRGLLLAHADVPAVDLPDFTSEDPYAGFAKVNLDPRDRERVTVRLDRHACRKGRGRRPLGHAAREGAGLRRQLRGGHQAGRFGADPLSAAAVGRRVG